MELLSSARSSKRAKAPGNMTQVVSCLVDGCNSDLSRCREYHRRHKVCEHHSKTPKVTIGGQEQRFCQQCSRFHSLIEFDEGKRSCRKRLDGHNRRRRKPQSESFHRTPGIFHSSQQGSRLLSFSNPQILPGYVSSARAGDVKREVDTMVFNSPSNYTDKHNLSTRSSAHSYKGGLNQFQFLQGTDHNLLEASSVCQPLFDPISASGNCANSQKMLPDRLNRVGNNHGALSLLSSARTETRDIGSSHMVHPDPIPMSQSLLQNLHFSGLDQYPCTHGMETKPEVSDLGSNITTLHFQGVCHNEFDDSSGSGSQQTLLFRWN